MNGGGGGALLLRHGEVQVWRFFYEEAWARDASLPSAYDALITPAERQRVRAFRFEKDQRQNLAARALVRTVLSHHAPVRPADWRFAAGANGRPFVTAPAMPSPLHFNLAHTKGLVVCAVSSTFPRVGVDAEALDRLASALEIADGHFTPHENALLRRMPPERQHHAFLRLWTLKEACIKATGEGLSAALDRFHFEIDAAGGAGPVAVPVCFDAASHEQSSHWRFAQWMAGERFLIALGADTGGRPMACRVFDTVPLHGHAEQAAQAFTAA